MATKRKTLGGITDEMFTLREERRVIAAQDTDLKTKYDKLEEELIELLDKEATTQCRGSNASATIGEDTQFEFNGDTGWDLFMAYIAKNKLFHLVQRRVSAPACRELFATKGKLPGLQPYTKRKINLRVL